tara:strand:+ start:100 stop:264 length:165 start_codon:yes stop_codon:yes gene_type:complete
MLNSGVIAAVVEKLKDKKPERELKKVEEKEKKQKKKLKPKQQFTHINDNLFRGF